MKLSIVIPCYNEQHTIASLVAAVNAAPYPDKEIIIVDDCSRDGTHAELEKLIAVSPKDWRTRVHLAAILLAERDLPAAMKQLGAAGEQKPDHADIHFLTGQILLQQEKRESALASFRKALELDPTNWRIRKQIWAIENPDKFYAKPNPDYRWQKEVLEKERTPSTPASP